MISYDEAQRLKQWAGGFNQYSIRRWVVLSLITGVAMIAILSKAHLKNPWVYLGALFVPASITLYFKNRIAVFGSFVYAATLIGILGAAVLFGT